MKTITIYSTQHCPYCVRAKMLLKGKSLEYTEILIDEEPEKKEEMLAKSNGLQTVPQIFIGEQHIGGFDKLWELERAGDLDKLLEN